MATMQRKYKNEVADLNATVDGLLKVSYTARLCIYTQIVESLGIVVLYSVVFAVRDVFVFTVQHIAESDFQCEDKCVSGGPLWMWLIG